MGMAVAIVPGLFVAVFAAGRKQFVQYVRQVFLETQLEFNGSNRGGAADIENMRDARPHA